MKVLLTADVLRFPHAGVQRYTIELTRALGRRSDVDLTVLCERPEHARDLGGRVRLRFYEPSRAGGVRGQAARLLAYALTPPRDLAGFDIIHAPYLTFPFSGRPPGPKLLATVHDLIPLVLPAEQTWQNRLWFRAFVPSVLRQCHAYIAVSEATRRDMQRYWSIPPQRVTVTPQGPRWPPAELPAPREWGDYFLAVGTIEPRKNLRCVIEAFGNFRRAHPDRPEVLKIVGRMGWERSDIHALIAEHQPYVQTAGFVPDEELKSLYQRAKGLVYPSLCEGFGLPVLEAMALGCPVITSDRSSLPEVGGDAVLYVGPEQPAQIAAAIGQLALDERLREGLSRRGLARASQFSWERCAEATVGAYGRALRERDDGSI